jgi:hypothetical protein
MIARFAHSPILLPPSKSEELARKKVPDGKSTSSVRTQLMIISDVSMYWTKRDIERLQEEK